MFSPLHFLPGDSDFEIAHARVIENYPPQALQVFEDLAAEMAIRGRDRQAAQDRMADVREAIGEAEFAVARSIEAKREARELWSEREEKALDILKQKVQRLKDQLKTLRPADHVATEFERKNVSALRELNGDADDFLHGIIRFSPRREMKLAAPIGKPRPLAKIHTDMVEAVAEFRKVRSGAPPIDVALDRLRLEIKRQGSIGTVDVSGLTRGRFNSRTKRFETGEVKWPERGKFSHDLSQSINDQLGISLVCQLWPDDVFEALASKVRAAYDKITPGLPLETRAAREAEIKAQWITLCRELVAAHRAQSLPLPSVHVFAILGVETGEMRPVPQPRQEWSRDGANEPITLGTPVAEAMEIAKANLPDVRRGKVRAKGK